MAIADGAIKEEARMNALLARVPSDGPQLRTILLTDLVDSTALIERLGDVPASELFREHDHLVLTLQQQWRGRLIDRSDGLLLLFERPIDGLGFALDYTRGLRDIGKSRQIDLQARAGLHVGELLTWKNSDAAVQVGAKPLEVEGLAKPMAARLMMLARPGQILLSAVAEPLARRAARELGERGQNLLWKSYGRWRFKGVPETQEVYEVGEVGIAPLRAPGNNPKAWRDIPLWRRPAALAAEVMLLAGLGIGAWFVTKPQPAIAFAERDWVVVGDLRNLTGQSVLDDSLSQAFRISLEQSRYVNVLSDMKVRDTLALMQRSAGTPLDRETASEIALREGASVVLLPSVVELNGTLRVTAELVDPRTRATVHSEHVDGKGVTSVLDSADKLVGKLRRRLGEAAQQVDRTSQPLPRVATGSLDALRAYTFGLNAYADHNYDEALEFFLQAEKIDPTFAHAYVGSMRIYVSRMETAKARKMFESAYALRSRLPAREAMYLDAWGANFNLERPEVVARKWKVLADLYPDYYAGHVNYAWIMFDLGRYDEALVAGEKATAQQNPMRAMVFDLVGRIKLAQGQTRSALESFTLASRDGKWKGSRQMAAAYAVVGDHQAAREMLDRLPMGDVANWIERVSFAADQGDLSGALVAAAKARADCSNEDSGFTCELFRLMELSLRTVSGKPEAAPAYESYIASVLEAISEDSAQDKGDRLYFAAAATYMAQRAGSADVAARNLPILKRAAGAIGDTRSEEMIAIVESVQLRIEGREQEAIESLQKMVRGGELFQVHVALRDCFIAAGDKINQKREEDWIAENRALAYAEKAGAYSMQPANVVDSNNAAKASTSVERLSMGSGPKRPRARSTPFISVAARS